MKSSRSNRLGGLSLSETLLILTQLGVLVSAAAAFENLLLRPPPSEEDPGEVPHLLLQRHHDHRLCGDGTFEERVFDEMVQPAEEEEEEKEDDGEEEEMPSTDDPEGGGSVAALFERRARKVKDSEMIRYLMELGHLIGTGVDTKTHRLYVGKRRIRPEQRQQGPSPSSAVYGRQRLLGRDGPVSAAAAATTKLRRLDLGSPWRWAFLPRIRLQP